MDQVSQRLELRQLDGSGIPNDAPAQPVAPPVTRKVIRLRPTRSSSAATAVGSGAPLPPPRLPPQPVVAPNATAAAVSAPPVAAAATTTETAVTLPESAAAVATSAPARKRSKAAAEPEATAETTDGDHGDSSVETSPDDQGVDRVNSSAVAAVAQETPGSSADVEAPPPTEVSEHTNVTAASDATDLMEEAPKSPPREIPTNESTAPPAGGEEQAAEDKPSEEDGSPKRETASAESDETRAKQGIFGSFFSKPFTNPFSEAAKSGKVDFGTPQGSAGSSLTISASPASGPFGDSLATSAGGSGDEASSPADSGMSGTRPQKFPGEDHEVEEYNDGNVILMRCAPVDTNKDGQPVMKFRRQGEGLLRLLRPKDDTEDEARRLVLRQKGTWSLLLNSPLRLSPRFDTVPTGPLLRFVAFDMQSKSETEVTLAAYCLKFESDAARDAFLAAVQAGRKKADKQS